MSDKLTVKQAATKAGVHPETIRDAIRSKEIEATRNRLRPGGPYQIDSEELDRFVTARTT